MRSDLWVRPRRDQVADERRRNAAMKLRQSGLQLLVGRRDAFMLALMLEPGGDQKRLDHAGGFGRVLIDVPVVGAVAQALGFERMQRGKKRLTILRPESVYPSDLTQA